MRHHLFLEFWLVDTWFFADWRHHCNSPRKAEMQLTVWMFVSGWKWQYEKMMAFLFPNCPVIDDVCEEKPLSKKKKKKKIAREHLALRGCV